MTGGLPAWLPQLLLHHRVASRMGKGVTHLVVASTLFTANMWLWHAPALYDLTLLIEQAHILSHLLYIATGLLFWWPLLNPLRQGWPPLSLGEKTMQELLILVSARTRFHFHLGVPYGRVSLKGDQSSCPTGSLKAL